MKKLVLSSIIMLGICSLATAQSAVGSQISDVNGNTAPKVATSLAPVAVKNDKTAAVSTTVSASDMQTTPDATRPVATGKVPHKVAATEAAVIVNDDGTTSAIAPEKQMEIKKAAAAKAAASKKTDN
ncbi:MAG: hypothetical protein IPL84_09700 [Chitinophagaceae bacterium]|nr:hypothetical protein [Chitinophagaceae bacterium]